MDCTLEKTGSRDRTHALRLGFREIKGFANASAAKIVAVRDTPFKNIEEFARRTGLNVSTLKLLAEADAFRSIGLDRRQALWKVTRFAETGTPAALLADLPLFAVSRTEPLPEENKITLPDLTIGEHVLQDYATIRMSLKAHPVGLLRADFARSDYVKAEELEAIPNGRRVQVIGIVLVRQRPGSAKGVVFATIEDETGVANIIIWPKIFEKFRRVALGARLLGVKGKLQKESGVIHVVADTLMDLSAYLEQLSDTLPPSGEFLSNAMRCGAR